MDIKSNINENIKFIRESNSLNQADFGKIIGKGASLVSAYEKGVSTPPLNIIQIISNEFNYSLDDLVNVNLQEFKKTNNNEIKSINNGNLKGNPIDNLKLLRQKNIDSIIDTESKKILYETFGDYGESSIADSEIIFKPSDSKDLDFQLFTIKALEYLNTLYLIVKLLLDNGYKFSKKETKELYFYEGIVHH
ncbi:MAG: helix-turn-helix transcriptional regulator, partial [Chryseobacterium sp.]